MNMRQMKFRAWFSHHNKMVQSENLFLHYDGDDSFDFAFDKEVLDEEGNVEGTMNFKVMQYTGLKDSKGVEIYEGDMLKCHHQTIGFVFYLDGSYHVSSDQVSLDYENHTTYDHLNNDLILDNNLLVIGNIHENPELLGDAH